MLTTYLTSIIVVAITAGLVNLLAPNERIGKYINFASALVIVIVVAAPLLRLSDIALPDEWSAVLAGGTEQDDAHAELVIHYSEMYLSTNTNTLLRQRFNLASGSVESSFIVTQSQDGHVIESVTIELRTLAAIARTDQIRTFVQDTFVGSRVIIVENTRG